MIDIVLLCATFGVFILASFKLGYQFGSNDKSKPTNEEKPKVIKETKKPNKTTKEDEAQKEFENLCTAINNLENYTGSSEGQVSIK